MLNDLINHKWFANALLLNVVGSHEASNADVELRRLLHHIILANRYWLFLSLGLAFNVEEESKVPASLFDLVRCYQETYQMEMAWIARISETDLARRLETPYLPDFSCSVTEAFLQICLHSHGHRAQCATRLRVLGATPPNMDFILWLKERPAAMWEAIA